MEKNNFYMAMAKNNTTTENGAVSNSSIGSALADQFAKAANYRGRELQDVFNDQASLWEESPLDALKFIFYLRLITRKIRVNDNDVTEKVQNGQGVKDEAFKRILWMYLNHSDVMGENISLLPIIGSWKDLWAIMFYDEKYELNCIDKRTIFEVMKQGLYTDSHHALIKKFMPRIKSIGKLHTEWNVITNSLAKQFAKYLGFSAKEYNKFKASGNAHEFQKIICSQEYDKLDFGKIPGRALMLLSDSKFLENHGLVEKFTEWVNSIPMANFTGYAFEIANKLTNGMQVNFNSVPLHKKLIANKQFNSLIDTAKKNGSLKSNVICALDTSGSMEAKIQGSSSVSALDVCKSLGIFFSTLNEGAFHKKVIMFDHTSSIQSLSGEFSDMLSQIPDNAWGGTNFMSVVREIARVRMENPTLPLEAYPSTLLVVSDMQFNPSNSFWDRNEENNLDASRRVLREVFPSEWVDSFKFVWWNVTSRNKDYPTTLEENNSFMISGFDGSIISMLLGAEVEKKETIEKTTITMEEVIQSALNQEIFSLVKVS